VALGLALAGPVAAAEDAPPRIYKWVDENGVAHYTTNRDRIPSNLRNRIRSVDELKREQAAAPPPEAAGEAADAAGTSATPPTSDVGPARNDMYSVRDVGVGLAPPSGSGDNPSAPRVVDPVVRERMQELDGRIAELETELAKEEQKLKALISEARDQPGAPAPLYGRPELDELARRFPELQAEIGKLRAERRRLDLEP
jgi:hypothetical protein